MVVRGLELPVICPFEPFGLPGPWWELEEDKEEDPLALPPWLPRHARPPGIISLTCSLLPTTSLASPMPGRIRAMALSRLPAGWQYQCFAGSRSRHTLSAHTMHGVHGSLRSKSQKEYDSYSIPHTV